MPLNTEVVANRPLSGTELQELLVRDFKTMLESDGALTNYAAYGRVSYRLELRLFLDNPATPSSVSVLESRRASQQQVAESPELEALVTVPQPDPSKAIDLTRATDRFLVRGRQRTRRIESPNRVRIENGLPIKVTSRDQGGEVVEREVKYNIEDLPPAPEGAAGVEDREMSREELRWDAPPEVEQTVYATGEEHLVPVADPVPSLTISETAYRAAADTAVAAQNSGEVDAVVRKDGQE